MSTEVLPPPRPPVCLTRTYLSRGIKGGTVIAEDVHDLQTHEEKLLDPDSYRAYIGPCRNSKCGSETIHAHCFRERTLRPADSKNPEIVEIRLFYCPICGAVFTVLPAFIARHLWRRWETVQEVHKGKAVVPRMTALRWQERLASDATQLVQGLLALAGDLLKTKARELLAKVRTRCRLVEVMRTVKAVGRKRPFAALAGWLHRILPGIRLM